MWTEIWVNYVMPIVASLGGASGIAALFVAILKGRANVKAAAHNAANELLDGIKGNISVDINELVEARLKKATEIIDKWKDLYLESQAALTEVIAELSSYFSQSPMISEENKTRLYGALEKARRINKGEVKTVEVSLTKMEKNKKTTSNDDVAR